MDSAHVIAWCEREKRARWPASAGRKSTWKSDLMVRGGAGTALWLSWSIVRRRIGCTRHDVCAQPNNPANGPLDVAISIVDFHVAGPVAVSQDSTSGQEVGW